MISVNMFYIGVVEDVNDPLQLGRLRVRWIGLHTENKSLLPTDMLPWADVIQPIYSAAISGIGMSPVGIVNGTMVIGFFQDDGFQQPIVYGTLAGSRNIFINNTVGFNDPDGFYPLNGVSGDINTKSGGSANTGYSNMKDSNAVGSVGTGSSDPTVPPTTLDPNAYKDAPWMKIATGELGVSEENNPARIKEYHKVGSGQDLSASVAWCSDFVNFCLYQVGINGTRSAMARSYLNYGNKLSSTNIPFGAIIVMQGTRGPSSGHVVFCNKDLGEKVEVIGGNQTFSGSQKYDTGGMVSKTTFNKSKIVGVCYPTNLESKSNG